MHRKDSVLEILSNNSHRFQAVGVEKIGVFGSVARSTDSEESDVDIFVAFAPEERRARNFNAGCDLLDELIGEPYDVVTRDGLSPYLGPKILEEAVYAKLAS